MGKTLLFTTKTRQLRSVAFVVQHAKHRVDIFQFSEPTCRESGIYVSESNLSATTIV